MFSKIYTRNPNLKIINIQHATCNVKCQMSNVKPGTYLAMFSKTYIRNPNLKIINISHPFLFSVTTTFLFRSTYSLHLLTY